MLDTALDNFTEYMNANQSEKKEYTLADVMNSEDGLDYWGTKHMDMSSGGPQAQQFRRSKSHSAEAQKLYDDLDDDLTELAYEMVFVCYPSIGSDCPD